MHDARAVANYLLDRAEASNLRISTLTLLKILYFAHAWHLVKFDQALVAQPFEAWRHGPVNRVVYEQVRGKGRQPLTSRLLAFSARGACFVKAEAKLPEETKKLLDNVFDYYARFDPFKLSDLTHQEGSPWEQVWRRAEREAIPGMEIDNATIKEWFGRRSGGRDSEAHNWRM
jgi:uncharacterized phage-associated protein